MRAQTLLDSLCSRGAVLALRGDAVNVRPRSLLTDDDRAALRQLKPELLLLLKRDAAPEVPQKVGSIWNHSQPKPKLPARPPTEAALIRAADIGRVITEFPDAVALKHGFWHINGERLSHDEAEHRALLSIITEKGFNDGERAEFLQAVAMLNSGESTAHHEVMALSEKYPDPGRVESLFDSSPILEESNIQEVKS